MGGEVVMEVGATFWVRHSRALGWTAVLVWIGLLVGLSLAHVRRLSDEPHREFINRTYERASVTWWERGDLYAPTSSFHGFLYLPDAAIAYTPFTWGNALLRDLSARLVFALLLIAGVAALARIGDPQQVGARFALLSVATMPLLVQNLRQGQMNPVLTGAMLLATAALAARRWGWAAAALAFGVAMKPLALVFLLLAGAAYPRALGWRLAVGCAVVLLLPFAFGPPEYVASQYVDFVHKMRATSAPTTLYYDLRGLLETGLGLHPSAGAMTLLRLIAALAVLGVALAVRRRFDLVRAAPYLYCLTACYLMLFNPKTEDPSYLLLCPAVGYVSAQLAFVERRHLSAVLLLAIPVLAALSYELLGGRAYWFRPLLALVFFAYVLVRILRDPSPEPGPASRPPHLVLGPGRLAAE